MVMFFFFCSVLYFSTPDNVKQKMYNANHINRSFVYWQHRPAATEAIWAMVKDMGLYSGIGVT